MKILVVDDEAPLRLVLSKCFTKWGHDVVLASDGMEAIEKFDITIDLVITDYRMPKLHGTDVIKKIREVSKTVRICMVSGTPDMKEVAFEVGADHFIDKPYSLDDLRNGILGLYSA